MNRQLVTGLIIFLSALGMVTLFQNCGNVNLATPQESAFASVSTKASGELCLDATETMESFFVSNLNSKVVGGKLVADSDADGLSDAEEISFATDPLKRRSYKEILDSICQRVDYRVRCESVNVVCTGAVNGLGLSDCDRQALRLDELYGHPTQGLDSDKDGIPDLLELRAGTFPNVADATEDPDHDLKENQYEIQIGSDPRSADGDFTELFKTVLTKTKLAPSTACPGERWQINISQVPLVLSQNFTSTNESWLSHQANENVILFVLKTRPKVGVVANAKIRKFVKKVQIPDDILSPSVGLEFSFSSSNFSLVGEVLP